MTNDAVAKSGQVTTRACKYRVEFNDDGSTRQVVLAENEDDPRDIIVREFPSSVTPVHASVSNSMKLNMGNYESAEVFCAVSLPCLPEELADTFPVAWEIVRGELRAQLTRLQQVRKKRV